MQSIQLFAAGRQQDLDTLYSKLVADQRHGSRNQYEIVRERHRLTARWEFGSLFFEQMSRTSRELPGLRLAVTWRFCNHNVGYCVYGAGIEELQDVVSIRGQRHADRLWKRANAVAEAHVF